MAMNSIKEKNMKRTRRHARVRSKINGTQACPRLNVYRSLSGLYLQLVDDDAGKTILSASTRGMKAGSENPYKSNAKTALAYEAGLTLAKQALAKKITIACFDRGGYAYHGRVQAAAEGARAGGLKF